MTIPIHHINLEQRREFPFSLVIVDKNFAYLGTPIFCDGFIAIQDAQALKDPGTNEGLDFLVVNGKQRTTVIGPIHEVIFPFHALISIHPTNPMNWGR